MSDALIVIDVQNDFCTGGALAVPNSDEIIPRINALMSEYDSIVLTQDWHPNEHLSFASSHKHKKAYDSIDMSYGYQVLWPDHCIQGSEGAEFHSELNTSQANLIIRKGMNPNIDSYSAFYENDKKTPTGLEGYLKTLDVTDVTLVGLATDFCVNYSAVDAAKLDFNVKVMTDLSRAIDIEGSLADAFKKMTSVGVKLI
ncbi:MAG: bifunctional nicotinamidase/pyrazinamidase [Aestuariivita sp.]|nr:bifunctional nicotinamidase/pyrazinamidase [Aestuariivita sp.]